MGEQYDIQLASDLELSRVTTPEELPWDVDPLTMTPDDLLRASGRWWEAEEPPQRIQQLLYVVPALRFQCQRLTAPS
jgi:hypothetical protein